ncbi:MAG: trimethylamine methyltransferase family protein, partial [Euryarchaeota archaeon]|nr:trimethylamine methyltransferase family protein [Euryarchaeota archaeon]
MFAFLSKNDFEKIHLNSLDILENLGIKIKSGACLKTLEKTGAIVDYEKLQAKFPNHLVEEALKKAPKVVKLFARDSKFDVTLDKKNTHFSTDGTGTAVIDFETRELRTSTAEDVAKSAKIANSLNNVHVYWATVGAQ